MSTEAELRAAGFIPWEEMSPEIQEKLKELRPDPDPRPDLVGPGVWSQTGDL